MKLKKSIIPFLILSSTVMSPVQAQEETYSYPSVKEVEQELSKVEGAVFPVGVENKSNEKYFTAPSYLAPVSTDPSVHMFVVTFAPGSINNWHVHHNSCQVLIGVSGHGYYQIWGEDIKELKPGSSVTIPSETKHWHGASPNSYFQHLAYMNSGDNVSTEWLEKVDMTDYKNLK